MAFLKHMVNGNPITVYELNDRLTIGRSRDNDVMIDDSLVSAVHAEVVKGENGYQLQDLNSTNGSFYQGKRTDFALLSDGKHFSIGSHEFEFYTDFPADLEKTMKIKKSWIPGLYYSE